MATSRSQLIRPAVRPAMKARLLLAGPSGAGKTRTALSIASVLADGGPIAMIDTEVGSALTYADAFTFSHLPWEAPFDPRDLGATIPDLDTEYAVIVVDSASHFWIRDGGTLDIVDGKFGGWKVGTPAQQDFVDAVLMARTHMIICVRSKMGYAQQVEDGKTVIKKLGLQPVQRDDLEYEMNVSAELDMEHRLTVGKTRADVLDGKTYKANGEQVMAEDYAAWLAGGEPVAPQEVVDGFVARMNAFPLDARKRVKSLFLARIGRPQFLRVAQCAEAEALIAEEEQAVAAKTHSTDSQVALTDNGESGPVEPGANGQGETPDLALADPPTNGDDGAPHMEPAPDRPPVRSRRS